MTVATVQPEQKNGAGTKTKNQKQQVKVTITSIGPGILMNPMTQDLLEELAGVKSRAASDKDQPLETRAEKKVIRNEDNEIGLPVEYMLAALIGAGRHVKNGKDKVSTATTTTLYSFLMIKDEFLKFTEQGKTWKTDMRRGVLDNGGKKVAVSIVRPLFKKWETSFTIEVDTTVASVEVVKQVFEAAGLKIGVGDFRPSKRGPFGMFSVTGWETF